MAFPRGPIRRRRPCAILPSVGRSPSGRLVRAGRRGLDSRPRERTRTPADRPFFTALPCPGSGSHERRRTPGDAPNGAEAHTGLREVAFKLRRQLTQKAPALKAAVKDEQEAFRLKRELQRLTLEDPE